MTERISQLKLGPVEGAHCHDMMAEKLLFMAVPYLAILDAEV